MTKQELKHYGVLGMKWGKRRYQNKNGTLTAAGKRKEKMDSNISKKKIELKEQKKESTQKYITGTTTEYLTSTTKEKHIKEDISNIKIKNKLNNMDKKSERFVKLENEYSKKGMSKEEASIAAYKRIRGEKIAIGVAGLTVAAAGAIVATKYKNHNFDKIIKSGKQFQRIDVEKGAPIHDAFYASKNKLDNIKYEGLYGAQLTGQLQAGMKTGEVTKNTFGFGRDLKVASPKNTQNIFSKLINDDSDFKNDVLTNMKDMKKEYDALPAAMAAKQKKLFNSAVSKLEKGVIDKDVYDAMNLGLANHTTDAAKNSSKKLYDKLKENGYDAILDINDKKYSGYNAIDPVIIFNGRETINNVASKSVDVQNAAAKAVGIQLVEAMAKTYIPVFGISTVTARTINNSSLNKQVDQYLAENPNTKMTNTEIKRMLELNNI